MDRIWGALLLSVLFLGCRQGAESPREAMVLCGSVGGVSKTDALTAGDEVAVFARIGGTESYFLEAAKFTAGADGKTLSATPAVQYPETKQAVNFYAYFPYHTGTFSVPTDQSTPAALKKADLCWATTSTTPVPTVVPLSFEHQLAQLVVSCTQTPTQIVVPNALSGGTLDATTGVFSPTTQADLLTTGSELILPAQSVSRLVLTVSGVEYTFEGAILLESGKTTSINLTLHPTTHTATLNGSSTTAWTASATQGNATQSVSNILTLHWPNYEPKGAAPTQATLTIGGTDYAVSSGITYANKTFTVPFSSVALTYPYTISNIAFLGVPQHATQLVGATIYKSGGQTVSINDKLGNPINPPLPSDYVKIGSLYWAKGNLVAVNDSECKVGKESDCGLFFQFGSLIGWSGGAAPDYNGMGTHNLTKNPSVKVTPFNLNPSYHPGTIWPMGGSTSQITKPYFSVNVTDFSSIATYSGAPFVGIDQQCHDLSSGRYAPMGVGDPCRFYLGEDWRVPNKIDVYNTTGVLPPTTGTTPSKISIVGNNWCVYGTANVLMSPYGLWYYSGTFWRNLAYPTFVTDAGGSRGGGGYVANYSGIHYQILQHGDGLQYYYHGTPIRCVSSV